MLSLKDLAARVIPQDVTLADLPCDPVSVIKHNKSSVKKCAHGTAWTYQRDKVNGPVTYICGCVQQWKDNEYVKYVVRCVHVMCIGECRDGGEVCMHTLRTRNY